MRCRCRWRRKGRKSLEVASELNSWACCSDLRCYSVRGACRKATFCVIREFTEMRGCGVFFLSIMSKALESGVVHKLRSNYLAMMM